MAESLRQEAARRGLSVYAVRVQREQKAARDAGRPIPSPTQAVGKGSPRTTRISAFVDGALQVVEVDRSTARRIARHNSLARAYMEGKKWRGKRVNGKRFSEVVGGWRPDIRTADGRRMFLVTDPRVIADLLDVARDEGDEVWYYDAA